MKNLLHDDDGFTLLEILAVLVITSVIAGIGVIKIIKIDKSAKKTQVVYEENMIRRMAINEYYFVEDKTETLEQYIERRIKESK